MTIIDCPGRHTFTSRKTRTSWGVFEDSNNRTARNRASTAVLNDLVAQINNAQCADGCLKQAGQPVVGGVRSSCERKWWSFWIVIRCEATANGSVEVQCIVQG